MKNLIAKLRETLHNPHTRDEMRHQMQALLHEDPLAKDEEELERPHSGTLDSLALQHEEEDKGTSMMHATLEDFERDMARAQLFKEKTMSSDSEREFSPRWAKRSLRSKRKRQPTHSPKHESAKWGIRVKEMQKRRQSLLTPASLSKLWPQDPIPCLQEEDKPSSSKQDKATKKHLHKATTPSSTPCAEKVESKGGEAKVLTQPKTQNAKPKSAKGARYKGKNKLSPKMIAQYLK